MQLNLFGPGSGLRDGQRGAYIFMASSCSFLGTISSIWGVSSGYTEHSCVRRERWTEDLTFDFEPGETLEGRD